MLFRLRTIGVLLLLPQRKHPTPPSLRSHHSRGRHRVRSHREHVCLSCTSRCASEDKQFHYFPLMPILLPLIMAVLCPGKQCEQTEWRLVPITLFRSVSNDVRKNSAPDSRVFLPNLHASALFIFVYLPDNRSAKVEQIMSAATWRFSSVIMYAYISSVISVLTKSSIRDKTYCTSDKVANVIEQTHRTCSCDVVVFIELDEVA